MSAIIVQSCSSRRPLGLPSFSSFPQSKAWKSSSPSPSSFSFNREGKDVHLSRFFPEDLEINLSFFPLSSKRRERIPGRDCWRDRPLLTLFFSPSQACSMKNVYFGCGRPQPRQSDACTFPAISSTGGSVLLHAVSAKAWHRPPFLT